MKFLILVGFIAIAVPILRTIGMEINQFADGIWQNFLNWLPF